MHGSGGNTFVKVYGAVFVNTGSPVLTIYKRLIKSTLAKRIECSIWKHSWAVGIYSLSEAIWWTGVQWRCHWHDDNRHKTHIPSNSFNRMSTWPLVQLLQCFNFVEDPELHKSENQFCIPNQKHPDPQNWWPLLWKVLRSARKVFGQK